MYAKFLLKESFLVEFSSLLEGMKMVWSSSLKLLKLFYQPLFGWVLALFKWPVLVRKHSPHERPELVELQASRWFGHAPHPPGQLYFK
jgi:hypothetical protein